MQSIYKTYAREYQRNKVAMYVQDAGDFRSFRNFRSLLGQMGILTCLLYFPTLPRRKTYEIISTSETPTSVPWQFMILSW